MAKRRSVIAAFLVLAILAVGVGYAAVSEKLTINGNATYVPDSYLGGEIASAIKFATGEGTITFDGYTQSASRISDNAADMTVYINDIGDGTTEYTSTATYTVVYDTADTTLPSVILDTNCSVRLTTDANQVAPGFTINVATTSATTDPTTGKAILAPGESMTVTVTVVYDTTEHDDGGNKVLGTINVGLTYTAIQE